MKLKLLALTLSKFQDLEMVALLSIFKASQKFEKIDFYSPENKDLVTGQFDIANIKTITNFNVDDYDVLYIPGGFGAKLLRSSKPGIDCVKQFIEKDKWVIAICDAPNALADHNLIAENQKYISWSDGDIKDPKRISDFNTHVFHSGKLITGRCPVVTLDLAFYSLAVIFGKAFSDELKTKLMGKK
ncbi:MAG: DJ-1/PfpI family protein [Malacoplasma sp.]|nr:DJ-1/PfpI family protein [Malacoplasma sp.]